MVLTMPVEEFSQVQYSTLPSVEWQQRGRKHGRSFARLHHRRVTWRSAVLWAEKAKRVKIRRRMLAQYGQSTVSQRKVYEWVGKFKSGLTRVTDEGRSGRPSNPAHKTTRAAEKLLRRNTETS